MTNDEQNLRLLSILHYVMAGVMGLFSLMPAFHIYMGFLMTRGALPFPAFGGHTPSPSPSDVAWMGWFVMAMGLVFMLAGWTLTVLILFAGRMLSRHAGRTFCIVVAGLECVIFPFGTALGVFTIILLMRDSVIALFQGGKPSEPKIADC